jgi:hypothetical protein
MGAVATLDHHLFCQTFSELAYISQPLCHKVRCEFGMVSYIALLLDMNSSGASVVEGEKGGKIHIKQAANLTALGASAGGLRGAMWGMLVGLLFMNPLAGTALGAIAAAATLPYPQSQAAFSRQHFDQHADKIAFY